VTLFNRKVLEIEMEELLKDLDDILDEFAPDGKSKDDFTGGYIQQLKNSNQLVAYFGTKPNSHNRATIKITIQADEVDLFYMMLKAKIHKMRNETTKTVSISMAQRKLNKQKQDEEW